MSCHQRYGLAVWQALEDAEPSRLTREELSRDTGLSYMQVSLGLMYIRQELQVIHGKSLYESTIKGGWGKKEYGFSGDAYEVVKTNITPSRHVKTRLDHALASFTAAVQAIPSDPALSLLQLQAQSLVLAGEAFSQSVERELSLLVPSP